MCEIESVSVCLCLCTWPQQLLLPQKHSSVVNTDWSMKQFFYDHLQTTWQTIGYSTQLQRDCESRLPLWTWKKNSQNPEQQWLVGISLAISLLPVRLIHWDSLQCLSPWQQDFGFFIYLGVDEICLLYWIKIRMQPRAEAEPVTV